jgi:hypothetical protein
MGAVRLLVSNLDIPLFRYPAFVSPFLSESPTFRTLSLYAVTPINEAKLPCIFFVFFFLPDSPFRTPLPTYALP